jgi:hypothetical protein
MLSICERCEFYLFHDASFLDENGIKIERHKYYCQKDNEGIEKTKNGVRFNMIPKEIP